jgi:hypothetical protein
MKNVECQSPKFKSIQNVKIDQEEIHLTLNRFEIHLTFEICHLDLKL